MIEDEKDVHLALSEAADLCDRLEAFGATNEAEIVSRVATMLFKFSTTYFLVEMFKQNDGKPIFKN
jgi:hypothetical protein